MSIFTQSFDKLIQAYIDQSNANNKGLMTCFDEDWPSPCITSQANNEELVPWLPIKREDEVSLSNLESALDITIPSDLHALFCRYYSHDINARAQDGKLTLLQAWNANDFDRLQKNLIAHVLMKRRLKQADTLFFALTDEDDIILSIDLKSHAVVVERVGKEPHKTIASNLAEFMLQITPLPELVML